MVAQSDLASTVVLTTVCNKSLLSHVSKTIIDFVPQQEQAAEGYNIMRG